jgi:hypothetical protein
MKGNDSHAPAEKTLVSAATTTTTTKKSSHNEEFEECTRTVSVNIKVDETPVY